jgi:hypothetical protein
VEAGAACLARGLAEEQEGWAARGGWVLAGSGWVVGLQRAAEAVGAV